MRLRDIIEVRRAEQPDPETQHMLHFEICPGSTLASLHHPLYLRAAQDLDTGKRVGRIGLPCHFHSDLSLTRLFLAGMRNYC